MATNVYISRGFAPGGFDAGGFWVYVPIGLALQQGTISPLSEKPIAGQQVALGQGAIIPQVSVPLVGQVLTLGQGEAVTGTAYFIAGQQLALGRGAAIAEVSIPLSGLELLLSQAPLVEFDISHELVGLELSLLQGVALELFIIPYDLTGAEYVLVDYEQNGMQVLNDGKRDMIVPAEENMMYVADDEETADIHHIIHS